MEFSHSSQIVYIRPYLWVSYPLGVFLLILISYTQMINGPGKLLDRLKMQNSNILNQQQQKTIRETKLSILKNTQITLMQNTLDEKLERMPYDHKPWELMARLKTVGNMASFQMSESKIISVEYIISDIEALEGLLSNIEKMAPLISIKKISYDQEKVKIELVSAFRPYKSFGQNYDRALPNLSK